MSDPYDLQRFVEAQHDTYERALGELRAGRKRSHWMWFVFPQIAGLGFSPMAQRYAITSLEEARAYLAHPILGPRLLTCTGEVIRHAGLSANAIFGSPDDMKFRSCMTLFSAIAPDDALFETALDLFSDGCRDQKTLDLIEERDSFAPSRRDDVNLTRLSRDPLSPQDNGLLNQC